MTPTSSRQPKRDDGALAFPYILYAFELYSFMLLQYGNCGKAEIQKQSTTLSRINCPISNLSCRKLNVRLHGAPDSVSFKMF